MIWLGWTIDRLQANPNMQSMENIVAEKDAQLPRSVADCVASHWSLTGLNAPQQYWLINCPTIHRSLLIGIS